MRAGASCRLTSRAAGSVGILIYAAPGVYWKRMVCTSFRLTSAKRLNEYRWANDSQNSYMFLLYDEQLPLATARRRML